MPVARTSDAAIVDPETGDECPPREVRRARAASLNAEDAIGEIVNPDGAGRLRGLLQQPRSQRGAHARRHVLDRRPRLPRRGRLLLLRRPQLRLAPRRRRELRGRAGRERDLARHPDVVLAAVYAVPVGRGRRRGDGRAAPARRRRRSTPTRSPRSSTRSPTSRRSGCRASCASRDGLPSTATQKVLKRVLAPRALGVATTKCGGARPRAVVPPAHADDVGRAARPVRRRGTATTCSDEPERRRGPRPCAPCATATAPCRTVRAQAATR